MPHVEGAPHNDVADVCLVLEGTYPYTSGGVSTWVHDLIRSLPGRRFALAHIGADRGAPGTARYDLPPNVTGLTDLYCREPQVDDADPFALRREAEAARRRHAARAPRSRVLAALRRLHLGGPVDGGLLDDLASGDLSLPDLLH